MNIEQVLQIKEQMMGDCSVQAVSGRALHEALGLVKAYTTWIASRIKALHLQVDIHYKVSVASLEGSGASSPRFAVDHILPLDVAKSISMMTGTEVGEQIRAYFLACEKAVQTQVQQLASVNPVVDAFIADLNYANWFAKTLNLEAGKVQKYAIEHGTEIEQKTGVKVLIPQLLHDSGLTIDFNSPIGTLAHAAEVAVGRSYVPVTAIAKDFYPLTSTDINNILVNMGYAKRTGKNTLMPSNPKDQFAGTRELISGPNKGKLNIIGWCIDDVRFWKPVEEMLIAQRDIKKRQLAFKKSKKGSNSNAHQES